MQNEEKDGAMRSREGWRDPEDHATCRRYDNWRNTKDSVAGQQERRATMDGMVSKGAAELRRLIG